MSIISPELDPTIAALFTQRGMESEKYPALSLFEVMGKEGDTKTIWDCNNPDEVAAARQQFDFLVTKKKYVAFHVIGKEGDKGTQMREFDSTAGRIIFVPPMAGG